MFLCNLRLISRLNRNISSEWKEISSQSILIQHLLPISKVFQNYISINHLMARWDRNNINMSFNFIFIIKVLRKKSVVKSFKLRDKLPFWVSSRFSFESNPAEINSIIFFRFTPESLHYPRSLFKWWTMWFISITQRVVHHESFLSRNVESCTKSQFHLAVMRL